MVTLAIVAALTALTVLLARTPVRRVVVAATVGLVIGAAMDWLLGYQLGLWYYTHHPYWTPDYFYLLYPAWASVSIGLVAFYDQMKRWRRNSGPFTVIAVAMVSIIVHEFAVNIPRDAWRYSAPVWLMVGGWPVYIWFLSFCVDKVQHALSSTKARRTV